MNRYCYFCTKKLLNGHAIKNTTAACIKCTNELEQELCRIKITSRNQRHMEEYRERMYTKIPQLVEDLVIV